MVVDTNLKIQISQSERFIPMPVPRQQNVKYELVKSLDSS